MRSIFVYEYLSGGGEVGDPAEAAELLPQGVAMRNAVLADLCALPDLAVTAAASPVAPAPSGVKAVEPLRGESPAAFVQRLARGHDLSWVIAPESDNVLARLHEAVGASRWIGCTEAAICVASSKRATLDALAARGVATPLAFRVGHTGRWIVKPDDGAGTANTVVHREHAAALADQRARGRAGRPATVEPYIDGEALSISMLCGPGFVQPIAFNRQQIHEAADGTLRFLGVEPNALDARTNLRAVRLHLVALDVARALPGLRGFAGVDVVWHAEHGPVVIEVNPRVTSAYVGLSAALRRNLAGEVLQLHALDESRHG